MELPDAYRVLEVEAGAGETAVRDARNLLAKVWHPDRHAHDAELTARAHEKLAAINEAYAAIRDAGFPSATGAAPAAAAPRRAEIAPAPPRPVDIELVPRRRIRWSVLLLLALAVGVGAYFAIVELGRDAAVATPAPVIADARAVAVAPRVDAGQTAIDAVPAPVDPAPAVVVVREDAAGVGPAPTPPASGTFTLGSSHEDVRAAQGAPSGIENVIDETYYYAFSRVDFHTGKVVGWWQADVPLHVSIAPRDPAVAAAARARGTLAVGSTRDEIIGVLGAPTGIERVNNDTWYYGFSRLELDDRGAIVEYYQADRPLHVAR